MFPCFPVPADSDSKVDFTGLEDVESLSMFYIFKSLFTLAFQLLMFIACCPGTDRRLRRSKLRRTSRLCCDEMMNDLTPQA